MTNFYVMTEKFQTSWRLIGISKSFRSFRVD